MEFVITALNCIVDDGVRLNRVSFECQHHFLEFVEVEEAEEGVDYMVVFYCVRILLEFFLDQFEIEGNSKF